MSKPESSSSALPDVDTRDEAETEVAEVQEPHLYPQTRKYVSVPYQMRIVWPKLLIILLFHVLGLIGWSQLHLIQPKTVLYLYLLGLYTTVGIEAGAHRLWSHRAYKAVPGLRVFLMIAQTMGFQVSIYEWVRDHRGHHKWSETDADPYSAARGVLFSHIGWIFLSKHPEVIRKGKTIDMRDIEADQIVMFQKRFYPILVLLFWGIIPAAIPVYFWGEDLWKAALTCVFMRHVYSLHLTFLVNSWAHIVGYRPYDKRIAAADVSIRHMLLGGGFHNFHHVFPWDYSSSELGALHLFNPMTSFIDLCYYLGLAYDLKKVNRRLLQKQMVAHGGEADRFRYQEANGLVEWITGMATYMAPIALTRWMLMACCD